MGMRCIVNDIDDEVIVIEVTEPSMKRDEDWEEDEENEFMSYIPVYFVMGWEVWVVKGPKWAKISEFDPGEIGWAMLSFDGLKVVDKRLLWATTIGVKVAR
ncbi:unnamed protein product [Dovyalis caffra]|uniref:Uncharacterized protein n=1 Tax=Dovyalis caffra TaxID=77055 RepID=A0AAV1QY63_9ROSI|nr:unnamed protein product [Dovyalis caffra]